MKEHSCGVCGHISYMEVAEPHCCNPECPANLASTIEPSTGGFTTKDSGQRLVFDSGMQRDVSTNKIDYSLTLDGPLFLRWAALLDRGARKYDKRNWMKATGEEELARFKESAMRHFIQWFYGDTDEDHAAAVLFNINGAEYGKEKLDGTLKGA